MDRSARLPLDILPQPDRTTCGPTCLHAIYRYDGDPIGLSQVVAEVPTLADGGTLAVFLACHALLRGYRATIHTYDLQMFDPTWFDGQTTNLATKLRQQLAAKDEPRLRAGTEGYLEFLRLGGRVTFAEPTRRLIRDPLIRGRPILAGLSATFLYRSAREHGPECEPDDIRGVPTGHFVVLCGYDRRTREVLVADPLHPNPLSETHTYAVDIERVLGAILLGILTNDANLLVLARSPARKPPEGR